MYSNGVKAMGGRHNHDQFPVHYRKNEGCKFIGKPGTMSIDYCEKCIRVHDGCTPGGCFKICAQMPDDGSGGYSLTASKVCEALEGASEIGEVEVIGTPAPICDVLQDAPVLGEVEVTANEDGEDCNSGCSGDVIGEVNIT